MNYGTFCPQKSFVFVMYNGTPSSKISKCVLYDFFSVKKYFYTQKHLLCIYSHIHGYYIHNAHKYHISISLEKI